MKNGRAKPFQEESKRSNTESSNQMSVRHECEDEGSLTQYDFRKQLLPCCKDLHRQHARYHL